MPLIRLDKYISQRSQLTRSQIKALCGRGKITVDGAVVKSSDTKIDPERSVVVADGSRILARSERYILLNKPEGYVSSTDDGDGPSVLELVPEELRTKDLFPAGRLDKDSLGALLITNDGELAHNILSPKRHVSKIYIVKLDRPFQNKYIDIFKNGVELRSGEVCLPVKVKMVENCEKLAFIELSEGKYHQVRRMFAAVDNHVSALMRVSVGGLILPEKLGFGQCMELLHKDVENLEKPLDFDAFCREFSGVFSAILINK
ncbi:MAG: rRNA pseudouridine synthase [Ruminococcus sp.]|nr:rRNA pseudouridine synthase [Ruminococcus sp.]